MTGQQLFVLIFTFIVGAVAGFYVYVTSFVPQYGRDGVDEVAGELEIIGEAIGGCQMGGVCESFHLNSKKRLSYIRAHGFNEDTPEPVVTTISSATYLSLLESLRAADFRTLKQPNDRCRAASDGIDYIYNITLDGISYELDSCGTKFNQSSLYKVLLMLWPKEGEVIQPEAIDEKKETSGLAPMIINQFGAE